MYLTSEFYTVNEVGQKSHLKKCFSYEYDMHIFGDKKSFMLINWNGKSLGRNTDNPERTPECGINVTAGDRKIKWVWNKNN